MNVRARLKTSLDASIGFSMDVVNIILVETMPYIWIWKFIVPSDIDRDRGDLVPGSQIMTYAHLREQYLLALVLIILGSTDDKGNSTHGIIIE